MQGVYLTPKKTTRIAILAALAAVLYFIPGIPIFPPIYKLDFSTLPALLGGYLIDPIASLLILLIKDLLGLFHSSSMGVGEMADFLTSGSFCLFAAIIYEKMRNTKGIVLGLLAGTAAMVLVGMAANYWILIPFYVTMMHFPEEQIVSLMGAIIPAVDSIEKMILIIVSLFNFIKAACLSIITILLMKPMKKLFEKIRLEEN